MRICLLSQDPDVSRLCREIVEGCGDRGFSLLNGAAEDGASSADVYVADYRPGVLFPPGFTSDEVRRTIVVVARPDLPALRNSLQHLPLSILLKPLNRPRLEFAFEQARTREGGSSAEVACGDRDILLQHLLEASLKIQEYDQDRTNFIGRAIHEFRAPLTSLNGYCGLLLSGHLGNLSAEQRETISRMRHSVARLSRLSSMLFDLSVAQRAEGAPALSNADILACVEQSLQVMAPVYQTRRITLDCQFKQPTGDLYFVPDQIEQVLVNLLENSCKFTPKGGSIEVQAYPWFWDRRVSHGWPPGGVERRRRENRGFNSYRVEIADSGPGIPAEHVRTIFEEYTSYSGGDDRSGAGLGLAICQMILRTHSGRIWAESNPTGAKFSFVLPYGAPERNGTAAGRYRVSNSDSKALFAF